MGDSVTLLRAPPPSSLIPPLLPSVGQSVGQEAEGLPGDIWFLFWSRTRYYDLANNGLII